MSKIKGVAGSMRVKKVKAPPPPSTEPALFRVTIGSPSAPGRIHEYVREAKARETVRDYLEKQRPFCARVNPSGLDAINSAQSQLAMLAPLSPEKQVIECVIDDYTGTTVVATLWKVT